MIGAIAEQLLLLISLPTRATETDASTHLTYIKAEERSMTCNAIHVVKVGEFALIIPLQVKDQHSIVQSSETNETVDKII